MKLTVQGKGQEVTIDKRNFLAKGGEGEIYAKDQTVYKICDPGKMIPAGKFAELSVLTDSHIIKPEDILLDSKGVAVGYTMKFVPDTFTLCQIFTKAFRTRNNITPDMVIKLVQQMQGVINGIHSNSILLVDLNELNFLLSQNFKDVWFIDVNSYQTPNYRATAIMDSIRDRHCQNNQFTTGTDWFSFAIVAFQMLIGIHPFKGRHPKFTDPRTAMDQRMLQNVSVLNTEVTYPQGACQPLTNIPQVYLDWFIAVFEKGLRVAPPKDLVTAIILQAVQQIVTSSHSFDIKLMHEFADKIVSYYFYGGKEVVVTNSLAYIDNRPVVLPAQNINVVFTPTMNRPVAVYIEGNSLKLHDFYSQSEIPCSINASNIMDYEGRLYIQNGMNVIEVLFTELPSTIIVSSHKVATCMEQATKFYDGVVIQCMFDAYYASIFPKSKQSYQLPLHELTKYKIVDAKFSRGVLMVVGVHQTGRYDRFVYRCTKQMTLELFKTVTDITFTSLNFTVLDNEICVCITEEENVEIFRSNGASSIKVIDDDTISGDMLLASKGSTTLFYQGEKLHTITSNNKP